MLHLTTLALAVLAAAPVEEPAITGRIGEVDARREARTERTKWGFMGVVVDNLHPALAEYLGIEDGRGLSVQSVAKDSPAAAAWLAEKDVLLELDGQILFNQDQFAKLVASLAPETEVTVKLLRKGEERSVKVKLGSTDRPSWRRSAAGGPGRLEWPAPGPETPGGQPPGWFFRWRDPSSDQWRTFTPDARGMGELQEQLKEWKDRIPEATRKKIEEEIRQLRSSAAEAARRAADGLEPEPAEAAPGAGAATCTITTSRGDYRAKWETAGSGPARLSLYGKDGKAIFENVPADEVEARLEGLPPEARSLVESVRSSGGGVIVR